MVMSEMILDSAQKKNYGHVRNDFGSKLAKLAQNLLSRACLVPSKALLSAEQFFAKC